MAGRQNPTFLKRQKEQRRIDRANAKRAARRARHAERAANRMAEESPGEQPAPAEGETPAGEVQPT